MSFNQFDIYWVNLDPTEGSEIKKTRPAVIVSPDSMNKVLSTVVVAPLTSTIIKWPFRTVVEVTEQRSSVACDHIRSVSIKRLQKKIGTLSKSEQRQVMQILQTMFL